jgi:hypothetical protein
VVFLYVEGAEVSRMQTRREVMTKKGTFPVPFKGIPGQISFKSMGFISCDSLASGLLVAPM